VIIGIDLGTTNSLSAFWRDGSAQLIPNALGSFLTPSAVSVAEDGAMLTGMAARERLSTRPDLSAAAFKRAMGTNHIFNLGKKKFRAEDLSALVLRSLKEDAERHLGQPVSDAVITVPAYFSDAQRKATRTAGQLAGLNVVRLLNEPTAAALAYGLQSGEAEQRVVVLDLGGGTFDVSILEMFEGVMEVRASAGDNRLGGEDFTQALADEFALVLKLEDKIGKGRGTAPLRAAILRAAEVAKRALSGEHSHVMSVAWEDGMLETEITRERYDQLALPLLNRMRAPVERALRDAKLMPNQIDHLVLAGGATRMPGIRRLAGTMFQRLPVAGIGPDEVVALGAAVQAGLVAEDAALEDRVMTDVAPFSMGIEVSSGHQGQVLMRGLYLPVIERNTVIPASRSVTVHTLFDHQRDMRIGVFQGEARMVEDNISLGAMGIDIPAAPAGKESVTIRFTYDVSGLLEVEAVVDSTRTQHQLVIESQAGGLNAKEIAARLDMLSHLKIHPRDDMINVTLLNRAERLYAERIGPERNQIAFRLDAFRLVLERQDPAEVETARAAFTAWLEIVDRSFFS